MDQPLSTPSGFRDTQSGGNLAVLLGEAATILLVGMVASLGFGIP